MNRLPINQVLLLALLVVVWLQPNILNLWGLNVAISLIGSFLLAQAFIMVLEYALIRYGVSRLGVIYLAGLLGFLGCVLAYYAWQQESYGTLNFAWIVMCTSFGIMSAAYKQRLGGVIRGMVLYLEYTLIALFVLAIFHVYVSQSPLAGYGLEYSGVEAESVWFIAMVILFSEIVYKVFLEAGKSLRKVASKIKDK